MTWGTYIAFCVAVTTIATIYAYVIIDVWRTRLRERRKRNDP